MERFREPLFRCRSPNPTGANIELAARLSSSGQKVPDNFLRRVKKLGALEADPNVPGGYKFPNRLHALVVCENGRVDPCYRLSTGSVVHGAAPGDIRRNMPDPIRVRLSA